MSEQTKKKMSLGKKVALGVLGAGVAGASLYGAYKLGSGNALWHEKIGYGDAHDYYTSKFNDLIDSLNRKNPDIESIKESAKDLADDSLEEAQKKIFNRHLRLRKLDIRGWNEYPYNHGIGKGYFNGR